MTDEPKMFDLLFTMRANKNLTPEESAKLSASLRADINKMLKGLDGTTATAYEVADSGMETKHAAEIPYTYEAVSGVRDWLKASGGEPYSGMIYKEHPEYTDALVSAYDWRLTGTFTDKEYWYPWTGLLDKLPHAALPLGKHATPETFERAPGSVLDAIEEWRQVGEILDNL